MSTVINFIIILAVVLCAGAFLSSAFENSEENITDEVFPVK